jgi:putative NADH-flavin reductase
MPATSKAKTATMHETLNDLSAQKRADVVAILNPRLADTIDLMHQAKQAHWNVKRAELGKDRLLIRPNGESKISMEDFGIAMIDELESDSRSAIRIPGEL